MQTFGGRLPRFRENESERIVESPCPSQETCERTEVGLLALFDWSGHRASFGSN